MALNQDIERLTSIPLFSVLERDAVRLIAFMAENHTLAAGEVLFRQGEAADDAWLVVSGVVDLSSHDPKGLSKTEAAATGVLLGETALLRSTVRPATAVARQPITLLRIPRKLFHRVLTEHPKSAVRLRAFLARRLNERLAASVKREDVRS